MSAAYARALAQEPLLETLPFAHRRHDSGGETLRARLLDERRQVEAGVLPTPLEPMATLVVIVRDPPGPALARTLVLWQLQSCPGLPVLLVPGGRVTAVQLQAWVDARGGSDGPRVGTLLDPVLRAGRFVLFAAPGDLLHPGLGAALARCAARAAPQLVCWSTLFRRGARELLWERAPGVEPLTLWHQPYLGRSWAVRAELLDPDRLPPPAQLLVNEGHLLLLRLARGELRSAVLPEPLTLREGAPPTTRDRVAPYLEEYREFFAGQERVVLRAEPRGSQAYLLEPCARPARISVIVCFRDRPELTCRCLRSLFAQETSAPLELILVDNQSRPESLARVEGLLDQRGWTARARRVPYPHPFCHSRQCNVGVEAARGDVLLFLNNDAELSDPRCVEQLARWALVPGVASVGCRLVDGLGQLVSAGMRIAPSDADPLAAPLAESTDASFAHAVRETAGNSFACAALSRASWDAVGPLDAADFPNGYNDAEWCLRARRAGLRHLYLGTVRALHTPGGSRARSDELPQGLELRRRYPELLAGAPPPLGREPWTPWVPYGPRLRDRLRARLRGGLARWAGPRGRSGPEAP